MLTDFKRRMEDSDEIKSAKRIKGEYETLKLKVQHQEKKEQDLLKQKKDKDREVQELTRHTRELESKISKMDQEHLLEIMRLKNLNRSSSYGRAGAESAPGMSSPVKAAGATGGGSAQGHAYGGGAGASHM